MRTFVATYKIKEKYSNECDWFEVKSKNIKIKYAKSFDDNIIAYVTIIAKNRFDLRGKKRSVEKALKNIGTFEKIVSIG